MALPDFKKTEQNKTAIPEWAKEMKEGEFISYSVTYECRKYLHLFDKYVQPCKETGDITYYVYDPVKHGADPAGTYPVLMWFHGASNSLMGDACIMCCGAEQYASETYQAAMGGAYLIVPLANEERTEEGQIFGGWADVYLSPVKAILDKVCAEHEKNIGKKFILGASSGGFFTWRMAENYPGFFDGVMPIASYYVPSDEALDAMTENGTELFIAHGRHDEMATFEECMLPRLEKLASLSNCLCFFPEWVYNGDGGIASVFYGFEMGQHCMINWVQHNLLFDDGTPADTRLQSGITGWIKRVCEGGICSNK